MKAILVRIGIDHTYGGWNEPVEPTSGGFFFVPISDGKEKLYTRSNKRRDYEVLAHISSFAERYGVHLPGKLEFPIALLQRNMHLDPDFVHLTYGDNGTRRGMGIAALGRDDLLIFYAGLRSITEPWGLVYAMV